MTAPDETRPSLTVAILTYRRPTQLATNLVSVARGVAEASALVRARVLVVDNDPAASARSVVEQAVGATIVYAHEPHPGIAAARNRALAESSDSRLLAFIDDDEIPQPGWLVELVRTWRNYSADAVMGRVVSDLPPDADPWAVVGGFFTRAQHETGARLHAAATGNLLLDLDTVRRLGIRFDESLGLGGGEDTLFSAQLVRGGGVIVACAESVTVDPVVPERATRAWVRWRAFSHGNVFQHTRQRLAPTLPRRLATRSTGFLGGGARMAVGSARAMWGVLTRNLTHRVRGVRAILRGAGVLSASVGYRHQEYRRTDSA